MSDIVFGSQAGGQRAGGTDSARIRRTWTNYVVEYAPVQLAPYNPRRVQLIVAPNAFNWNHAILGSRAQLGDTSDAALVGYLVLTLYSADELWAVTLAGQGVNYVTVVDEYYE